MLAICTISSLSVLNSFPQFSNFYAKKEALYCLEMIKIQSKFGLFTKKLFMYTVFYDTEKLGCSCLCTMHQMYANKTLLKPEQQARHKVFWDISKLATATQHSSNTPEWPYFSPLVAMSSEVPITSPKWREWMIGSTYWEMPCSTLKYFPSPCILPYKVWTFLLSVHVPRLRGQ